MEPRVECQPLHPSNSYDEAPIRAAQSAQPAHFGYTPPAAAAPLPRPILVPASRPAPATRRAASFDAGGGASSAESSSSNNHSFGPSTTAAPYHKPPPAQPQYSAPTAKVEGPRGPRPGAPGGSKRPIGEGEISEAVAAGILGLEQAERLWRFWSHEGNQSAPATAASYDSSPDPRFKQGSNTRAQEPQARGYRHDSPLQEATTDPPARDTSFNEQQIRPKKGGWNFDTEVQYDETSNPEPAPALPHRRPGQARASAAGAHSKPEWSNDVETDRPADDYGAHATQRPRGSGAGSKGQGPSAQSATAAPLSNTAGDKLALLKARANARGQPQDRDYAPGISYQSSPFGTSPPAQPQPKGFKGSAPPMEEDYTTGRVIEYEEEHQDFKARSTQLEVEMYEASDVPMTQCRICGRSFREDRISKHTAACEKSNKQRKVFNMLVHRQEGDAIKALKEAKVESKYQKRPPPPKDVGALPKWKQQHLEFQNALKCGRTEPGSGPPMPPPRDTRTECPHCGRRFAEDVADRHIPKCKNIINKPRSNVRRT